VLWIELLAQGGKRSDRLVDFRVAEVDRDDDGTEFLFDNIAGLCGGGVVTPDRGDREKKETKSRYRDVSK
jgi:hypothetical protein